nr:hypothetical protein [Nocardia cyriacigeorgica]
MPDWASWPEFVEPGLDVEDWRAVHGVEFGDVEVEAVDPQEPGTGDPEPIDPAHVAVSEDSDCWPFGVVPGAAGAEVQIRLVGQVEPEHDLEMAEFLESLDGFLGEARVVDPDDGFGSAPVIVCGFAAPSDDVSDGNDFEDLVCHVVSDLGGVGGQIL